MQERTGGEANLITHIGQPGGKEVYSWRVRVGEHEGIEADLHSVLARQASDACRQVGERALGFPNREQAELEESIAGHRRDEVRVAPASV